MDVNTLVAGISTFIRTFLANNWSLVLMGAAGLLLWKVLKSSIQLVASLVVAGLVISVLTNMGVLPPMDQIIEWVKSLVS